MPTFDSSGQPSVPLPASIHNARSQTMAGLEARLAGKKLADLNQIPIAPKTDAPVPVVEASNNPKIELAPEEPAVEPTVVETPIEEPAESVHADNSGSQRAATQSPASSPQKAKLSKSMQIQRRAEEAARRARAEVSKLRQQPAKAPEAAKAAQPSPDAEKAQYEIGRLKAQYEDAVRHLNDDPLGFMKAHGLAPDKVAAYVASGADPNQRAIENMRRESARAFQNLKAEYDAKLSALHENFVASQEATAQQNFFQFVEETKATNPEAFAALSSELVYSPADIWNVANKLLETRADLRDDFNEDKLLEAVEAEARKDPRWGRIQAINTKLKQQQSNVAVANQSKPNVSEKVESQAAPKPAQAPRQQPKRDPLNGQFQQPGSTPFTRHQSHVDGITRRVRILNG